MGGTVFTEWEWASAAMCRVSCLTWSWLARGRLELLFSRVSDFLVVGLGEIETAELLRMLFSRVGRIPAWDLVKIETAELLRVLCSRVGKIHAWDLVKSGWF